MQRKKTRDMVLCAMFVVLIGAGAFLKIPVPVVPFTLQYLFTMLAGLLLGPRLGALSVAVYVLLGLVGCPSLPREAAWATCSSPALAISSALSWAPGSREPSPGGGGACRPWAACWGPTWPVWRRSTCAGWHTAGWSPTTTWIPPWGCGPWSCIAFSWLCRVICFCVWWAPWQADVCCLW